MGAPAVINSFARSLVYPCRVERLPPVKCTWCSPRLHGKHKLFRAISARRGADQWARIPLSTFEAIPATHVLLGIRIQLQQPRLQVET